MCSVMPDTKALKGAVRRKTSRSTGMLRGAPGCRWRHIGAHRRKPHRKMQDKAFAPKTGN